MANKKKVVTQRTPKEIGGVLFFTDDIGLATAMADGTVEQAIEAYQTLKHNDKDAVLAMPDMHHGYGLPVGGVYASFLDDKDGGIVSPGAVGFDIGCGVRFGVVDGISEVDLRKAQNELGGALDRNVTAGLGQGRDTSLPHKDFVNMLLGGARWAVQNGFGLPQDLEHLEEHGGIVLDLSVDEVERLISKRAFERAYTQVGTLGSGNHFAELGFIKTVFDKETAEAWGMSQGQATVFIHTGSRAFGHQVATDYVNKAASWFEETGKPAPRNKNLVWLPTNLDIGKDYLIAMNLAANFAFANRQMIFHLVRKALNEVLGVKPEDVRLVWGLHHNMAKVENHHNERYLVHRKGATRAFGPSRAAKETPQFAQTGQPVLVPGSMGTMSYIMAAQDSVGNEMSFATSNHGSGRVMSRKKAEKNIRAEELEEQLTSQGILVRRHGEKDFVQEAPQAYKDSDWVSGLVEEFGIARRVVGHFPIVVLKG